MTKRHSNTYFGVVERRASGNHDAIFAGRSRAFTRTDAEFEWTDVRVSEPIERGRTVKPLCIQTEDLWSRRHARYLRT